MNAERLQAVLDALRADFARSNLASLVDAVATAYTQSLSSPSPSTIQSLDTQMIALSEATQDSAAASLSPSAERLLNAIGGAGLVGQGLSDHVSRLIAGTESPAAAVVSLQQLVEKLTTFHDSVTKAYTSLKALGVTPSILPDDSCEVGVTVPEELVGASLGGFQRKLGDFDRTVRTFAEVTGEEVVSPPLRDLARSSYQFFIAVAPLTAAAIATAIERSVALYKQILEIRKLRGELEQRSVPAGALDAIKAHEGAMIDAAVSRVKDEILLAYAGDLARKNELSTALETAIKFLAGQIDKGVDVEVTCNDPSHEPVSALDDDRDPKSLFQAYERVRSAGSAIRTLPADRAPVLFLPPAPTEPPAPTDPGVQML
ncbi:MAG TPA: hypothetical protein VK636_23505 [Gemmatimonadaceae bacterium]|nr:hypothetical protein [Gemmatimonadaceae bacterium]